MEYPGGSSAGSLPRRSQVVITARPPGRRTRAISRISPFLSGTSCRASMHMMASTVVAGSEVSAASATMNDACGRARIACPPRRLRDRPGREIDPGQAGTGYAREPQPDPAATAAQVEEAMAWLEPQL